jgi:hypothetical protein
MTRTGGRGISALLRVAKAWAPVRLALGQPPRARPAAHPGATDPAVTQQNITETICRPGWTRAHRRVSTALPNAARLQARASNLQQCRRARLRDAAWHTDCE